MFPMARSKLDITDERLKVTQIAFYCLVLENLALNQTLILTFTLHVVNSEGLVKYTLIK